jgi:hypothetical protein
VGAPHPTLIRRTARWHEPPACSLCCVARLSLVSSATSVAPSSDSPRSCQRASTRHRLVALATSATTRFVPSGVVHARRCMTHAPFGWKETSMQAADQAVAKMQAGRAMLQGRSWREAMQAAGLQMSRATAYRWRPRMLARGEDGMGERLRAIRPTCAARSAPGWKAITSSIPTRRGKRSKPCWRRSQAYG